MPNVENTGIMINNCMENTNKLYLYEMKYK